MREGMGAFLKEYTSWADSLAVGIGDGNTDDGIRISNEMRMPPLS